MIQVCSRCATRWNVRDKQRTWCPRCQAALLPPSADPRVSVPGIPNGPTPRAVRPAPGLRWVALRPGTPPRLRGQRRPLSPTPRYPANPGWGLVDYGHPAAVVETGSVPGPSERLVRGTLNVTAAVLGVAAAVHALRYLLLVVNRDVLLHRWVAGAGFWLGVIATPAAIIAVIVCAVVLTRWLITRRASVFAHLRRDEPRTAQALRAGCLIPLVNLFWAPVYVIETATAEGVYSRLRQPVKVWWALWGLSTAVSMFATATAFTTDAQGIADNTVTVTIAYLLALATVLALRRVYDGFISKPVERPAHRWVIVDAEQATDVRTEVSAPSAGDEPRSREPAA